MEAYRQKIMDIAEVKRECDRLKACGKKIVFTNGCFDILHPGHTRYLYAARNLGDFLIVAVNSDRSVAALKGETRPILPQLARAELTAAMSWVDAVLIFDEETPYELIKTLRPHVLVKGGDWDEGEIVGADLVKAEGGEVHGIPYVGGFSTTQVIQRILDLDIARK
jgi:D-beta-D-heptose 7-phosphate kinase/D-beta-D-heptose 1-phosphate adenosyltransferase